MNAIIKKSLFLTFVLVMTFSPRAAWSETTSILLFHSYHRGYKWTDDINRGIESVFTRQINRFERQIEYVFMDTKRYGSPEYLEFLRQTYRIKFKDRYFDVIVASDNTAFEFLLDHRDELFPGTPVVFCGVNDFHPDQLQGQTGFTGVNEATEIDSTLALMLSLHPETENLLVIEDNTPTGRAISRKVTDALKALPPQIEVIRLRDISMPALQQTIIDLPPQSLILHTFFFRDSRGVFYEYDQSLAMISRVASVPIYGIWDFSLGNGIVGGRLASGFFQGEKAAELAMRILNGNPVDQIPFVMKSPNRYLFDDHKLRHFKIARRKLPKESHYINLPDPRLKQAQRVIAGISLGSVLIILLLINLLRMRQRHRLSLERINHELEIRVDERTQALATANRHLQKEVVERTKAEERIRQMAFYDPLTQLANRNLFKDRFEQAIAHQSRHGGRLFLLYLDLDGFKEINDRYGHRLGDEVLSRTAQRLLECVRRVDTVARFGGDEFIILMPEGNSALEAENIMERIYCSVEKPLTFEEHSVSVGASIGLAVSPEQGKTLETLLHQADQAMYEFKNRRKAAQLAKQIRQAF